MVNNADVEGCGAATVEAGFNGKTFTLDGFENHDAVVGVSGTAGGREIEVEALKCSAHRNHWTCIWREREGGFAGLRCVEMSRSGGSVAVSIPLDSKSCLFD